MEGTAVDDELSMLGGARGLKNVAVAIAMYRQEAYEAFLDTGQGVVHQRIFTWIIDLKLDHGGAAWGD